ncbi:biotin-dependent carboxyltransferase family protein [Pontibacter sp. MBLB2868]|uniref:5-oxoprolinase subunit C family protein n=1 Tax=Pontibacter sp. MBLB2868 TaxID=3451555 RepID=UPI003F74BDE6
MSIKVIKPGLLTTVQDLGRCGHQKEGVIVSGAMDSFALRAANLLVGNPESEAALEATLIGPTLHFEQEQIIAITGADMAPSIHGERVKMWRPVLVRAGSTLQLGPATVGCRTYISVAGGLKIPCVMGSKSTYLKAGIGGYKGRALQANDHLTCVGFKREAYPMAAELQASAVGHWFTQANWSIDPQQHSLYQSDVTIRVLQGLEYELFSESSKDYFWNDKYQVSANSDRMGYALVGSPLKLTEAAELLSSAVTIGTVQVPPQGNPIILMADHQTTGGYPRIAQVISADIPKLAQVQAGKTIRFKEVDLKEAHELYLQQELNMRQLKSALSLKMNHT